MCGRAGAFRSSRTSPAPVDSPDARKCRVQKGNGQFGASLQYLVHCLTRYNARPTAALKSHSRSDSALVALAIARSFTEGSRCSFRDRLRRSHIAFPASLEKRAAPCRERRCQPSQEPCVCGRTGSQPYKEALRAHPRAPSHQCGTAPRYNPIPASIPARPVPSCFPAALRKRHHGYATPPLLPQSLCEWGRCSENTVQSLLDLLGCVAIRARIRPRAIYDQSGSRAAHKIARQVGGSAFVGGHLECNASSIQEQSVPSPVS